MVLAGELAAGEKLNELGLAERLGVSRGPVREALRALAETGLVRLEKNRGVFVREISVAEADEIYELRATLDQMAGRKLARTIRPEQLEELHAVVKRMQDAAIRDDREGYHLANLRFHDALVEFAGNGKLLQMYRRLVNELSLFRRAHPGRAAAAAQVDPGAPEDPRPDRRRRRRGRRRAIARACDGEPRADAHLRGHLHAGPGGAFRKQRVRAVHQNESGRPSHPPGTCRDDEFDAAASHREGTVVEHFHERRHPCTRSRFRGRTGRPPSGAGRHARRSPPPPCSSRRRWPWPRPARTRRCCASRSSRPRSRCAS